MYNSIGCSTFTPMTTDEMCYELAKSEFLTIDFENGLVYSKRVANKKIGCKNKKGYIVSTIHLNGERKQIKLHRLIWIAKYGMIKETDLIDHIDRIKYHNGISNLRLVNDKTNAENRRSYIGEENPSVKISLKVAELIREDYKTILSYSKLSIKYNVSKSLIAQIIKNQIWKLN